MRAAFSPFQAVLCLIAGWAAFGLSAVLAAEPESPKPSPEMELILKHHQTAHFGLSTEGAPLDKAFKRPKPGDPAFEFYHVPHRAKAADDFRYSVVLEKATGHYWIIVTGGFAGVYRPHGPLAVEALKKAPVSTEPPAAK